MSSSDSDSSDFDEHQYFKAELLDLINQVESTGSFAAFDVIDEFVNPGISVDCLSLRLPLSMEDAQSLIQMSQQAPFGLGTKTLIDESVRKTSQIDACNIKFSNKKWPSFLESITTKAAEKLGVACSTSVRAELHKMLIYEKGAMFKAHKDTEKIPGMFGTLVICLPSFHVGGDVHLQHGHKSARFATSDSSSFDASYIAWYGDVTHEITSVEDGFRWVLIYNLVNVGSGVDLSAGALQFRLQAFGHVLKQWQDLSNQPPYLIYPLAHQYTQQGLELARLKGEDYHRVRHIVQCCTAYGEFQVLLANMELCVTDLQDEDSTEESELYLTSIVDLGGFDFSIHSKRTIAHSALLGCIPGGRYPDIQRGGGYMGNQHAEIDQFFKDSVLIIVPDHALGNLLLGTNPSYDAFERLMSKLRMAVRTGTQLQAKQFMLSLCQHVIRSTKYDLRPKDLGLGSVAVSAMFLHDHAVFAEALKVTKKGYPRHCYVSFGEMIDLQNFAVAEDDLIQSLTKNGLLHSTLSNLQCLRSGFLKGNADREDAAQTKYLQNWLDSIAYSSFINVSSASAEDAHWIVSAIVEREDESMNNFILYQGARQFVDRFSSNTAFVIPAVVEILNSPANAQRFLSSLLARLLKPAITHFDLKIYAAYIKPHHGRDETVSSPGPIKRLYTRVQAFDSSLIIVLLTKINTQVCSLNDADLRVLILPLLLELLPVLDSSSIPAQDCVYILLSTYVQKIVGHEPERPKDWSRPAEIRDCWQACQICTQINSFLQDPTASFCWLPCDSDRHFRYTYDCLKGEYSAKKKEFKMSKTLLSWEKERQDWQRRADDALQKIGNLPQGELRTCLGKRFENIMDLNIVRNSSSLGRVGDEEHSGSHRYSTRSTVPRKRALDG